MQRIWRDYSLSLVLFLLFFVSWIGQGYFQWQEFTKNQQEHNQPVKIEEFMPEFMTSTLENWQSEFLQLFSFVVLTSIFMHKGSPESKDSDQKMERALNRIERAVGTKKKK